ncbi:MAG TPA: cytochrome d ubiquinol oxidase subunit II [Alphaproteobacteria bacterium]|nr:cytochrome d ubiquinol oxidase subunit II [Alphaproteobacteria bacterium]
MTEALAPHLPLIWAAIIAFAVFMYVLMDGFDLGVGILFRAAPSDADRDRMMNSVAPVWDGNETWLVLGGGGLLAAFPLAYAIILPALYIPLLLMLIALVFRGVAFEFRFKANTSRHLWDKAFHYGSVLATFMQGVSLGAFIQGFEVTGRDFTGGPFDWATPFSLLTGCGLVAGYVLLGAGWLILKTDGALQDWSYKIARRALIAVLIFVALVSLTTPLLESAIATRWFSWPNIAYLSPVPIATALLTLGLWRALATRRELAPLLYSFGLFALSYLGLAISLWPNVVPPGISIWQAASAPVSQLFMLVGAALVVPVMLGYIAYSYWLFRGKVRADAGYH